MKSLQSLFVAVAILFVASFALTSSAPTVASVAEMEAVAGALCPGDACSGTTNIRCAAIDRTCAGNAARCINNNGNGECTSNGVGGCFNGCSDLNQTCA
ncbi:MAG: hypothetical protein RLY93_07145 [Sumerlaeia bacterium]